MKTRPWFWFLPMLLLTLQAQSAQTIWRCGPDGRVFSDRPCSEGQLLAAAAPATAEDIRAAEQVAARERQLADSLRAERHARARVPPGSGLMAIGPTTLARQDRPRKLNHHGLDRGQRPLVKEARQRPPRLGKERPPRSRGDEAGRAGDIKRPPKVPRPVMD